MVSFCQAKRLHFPLLRKASYPITSERLLSTSFTSCYCEVLEFVSVDINTNHLTLVSLFWIKSVFTTTDQREQKNSQSVSFVCIVLRNLVESVLVLLGVRPLGMGGGLPVLMPALLTVIVLFPLHVGNSDLITVAGNVIC